jgi:starch synthase
MDILFITAATEPGGVRPEADAVAALAKALRGLGHKVALLSPLYRHIDPAARSLARRLTKIEVDAGSSKVGLELYTGRTPNGIDLVYLGNEELFGSVGDIGEGDDVAVARRIGAFARGAASYLATRDTPFETVHGLGVTGAAAIAEIRRAETAEGIPLLVGVLDASDQGQFEGAAAEALALGASAVHGTGANALKAGLLAADAVTASSPTRARALRSEPNGFGLESVYRDVGPRVTGILMGVDSALWNPLTDAHLPARFDPIDRSGKTRSKATLQRKLALPVRDDIPLIGVIGHTDAGRGMDLVTRVASQVLRNDVQLVVQIDGDGELVSDLEDLWDRWPDRIQIRTGAEEAFSHQLLGASDLFLVPLLEGPTTSLGVAAQRYGAFPVAGRESAIADAIVDCDPELVTGSGFLFDQPTDDDLLAAIRRAIAAFSRRDAFEPLRERMMRVDRSIERTARGYERLYRDLSLQRERTADPGPAPSL